MKKIFTQTLALLSLSLPFLSYAEKPNVIIIYTDDQGYQDLGVLGAKGFKTPNIDNLASQGFLGKSFYVSACVCTPSRAALQTAKYHFNINLYQGDYKSKVYFPYTQFGMPQSEITIAEMLKTEGYKTALIGKWHLGHKDEYLPTAQGYDYFYGIPFSNDMWLPLNMKFADNILLREGVTIENIGKYANDLAPKTGKNDAPLMRANEVIEFPADQATLSQRYVDESINFIANSKSTPFFLCLTPTMPHNPLFATDKYKGSTERGLYGDVLEELDANIGRLIDYLKQENLFDNTIIFFASDNGPFLKSKNYGSALPLKGGKFSLDEGGVRVPFIVTYPKLIKANTQSDEILANIDILPTIAELVGATLPEDIDGVSFLKFVSGEEEHSPRDEFIYANSGNSLQLLGIRKGDWKLISSPKKGKEKTFALYNLKDDIGEKTNLFAKHPEKAKELILLLEERRIKAQKKNLSFGN